VGAVRAAQRGARVAVIERERMGGVCLNRGCIPTKTIIASVNALRKAREAEKYGIRIEGEVSTDPEVVWKRKEKVVDTLVRGVLSLLKSHGITLIRGCASFEASDRINVETEGGASNIVGAKKVVIATGSSPAALPGIEPDGRAVLTSDDVLAKPHVPKSLIIVGAGAIGMEFAGIFAGLGSAVAIVEMLPRPLPNEDEDVSALIAREYKKQKIKIITSEKIEILHKTETGVRAELSGGAVIDAETVLVSVGRAFNTEGLGLEAAGIVVGKRGEIPVNDKMETGAAGVYAVGDVVGGPMLAHVASAGGIVAADNAMGADRVLDLRVLPACTYTHPEVASVGLREYEARENGVDIEVGKFPLRALGMAHAVGEMSGEIKVVANASGKVLGVHIVGAGANSLIHEAALAVKLGLTVNEWASIIHAHPSMSEALVEAAEDVTGSAINLPKRKK